MQNYLIFHKIKSYLISKGKTQTEAIEIALAYLKQKLENNI